MFTCNFLVSMFGFCGRFFSGGRGSALPWGGYYA